MSYRLLTAETADEPAGDGRQDLLEDPNLVAACATAVDALEIAARFETAGLSNQVALESYGHRDVFALADAMFDTVPFQAETVTPGARPPGGGLKNLARGALFALPTLLFTVAVAGLDAHLSWWSLPLGITTGWAGSQFVPVVGWVLRGRQDQRSDALLPIVALVLGAGVSTGLSVLCRLILGGSTSDTIFAGALCIYLVASALLLLRDAEVALAVALAPGAVVSLMRYVDWPFGVSARAAAWSVIASGGLVVAIALRRTFTRRWTWPRLDAVEQRRVWQYLLHGVCCGTLTSVVIFFSDLWRTPDAYRAFAVWPLLLSLGVMEWQLCSYRRRGFDLLHQAADLPEFARRSRRSFWRHLSVFVVCLFALTAGVEALAGGHDRGLALLLVAEAVLGVAFYIGLVLETSGRIDLTLRGWGVALLFLSVSLSVEWAVSGRVSANDGIVSLLAGVGFTTFFMAGAVRKVVVSPFRF